jgi:hypothetical protein
VKERPILFSSPMVRAILERRKRQTRRVVKGFEIKGPNPPDTYDFYKGEEWVGAVGLDGRGNATQLCPYGKPGDRLWVRETCWTKEGFDYALYVADGHEYVAEWKKRPSIFMPRWASRITLEVTGVRVERLAELSDKDAIADGGLVQHHNNGTWDGGGPAMGTSPRIAFMRLWDSINGFGSFEQSPWVWVIEFRRLP